MSIDRSARYRQRVTEENDPARNRASRLVGHARPLATTGRLGVGEARSCSGQRGHHPARLLRARQAPARRPQPWRRRRDVGRLRAALPLPQQQGRRRPHPRSPRPRPRSCSPARSSASTAARRRRRPPAPSRPATTSPPTARSPSSPTPSTSRPRRCCAPTSSASRSAGVARPESYEVTGPLATLVLQQLWLDVAIVGVNGPLGARGGDVPARGRGGDHPHHDRAVQAGHLRGHG